MYRKLTADNPDSVPLLEERILMHRKLADVLERLGESDAAGRLRRQSVTLLEGPDLPEDLWKLRDEVMAEAEATKRPND